MKKLFLMVVSAMLLLSCGDVYRTYETYEIIKTGTDLFTDYVTVHGDEWFKSSVPEGKPGFYTYHEFSFNEIDNDVLDKGAVLVYLIDSNNRENILPYVYPVQDNTGRKFMQNIRYEVEKGLLTIVVEWEDFYDYTDPNSDYVFKVCILSPGASSNKK